VGKEKSCKFPAGKYYIGDPCYVFNHENWLSLLEKTGYFEEIREFEYKGKKAYADSTAYGDGQYRDNFGDLYGVDAGLIGIMPIEVIDCDLCELSDGKIVEFTEDFKVSSNNGLFIFGKIIIDTRDE
jgi:hypothetical protein